jgi:hypothetical protein
MPLLRGGRDNVIEVKLLNVHAYLLTAVQPPNAIFEGEYGSEEPGVLVTGKQVSVTRNVDTIFFGGLQYRDQVFVAWKFLGTPPHHIDRYWGKFVRRSDFRVKADLRSFRRIGFPHPSWNMGWGNRGPNLKTFATEPRIPAFCLDEISYVLEKDPTSRIPIGVRLLVGLGLAVEHSARGRQLQDPRTCP